MDERASDIVAILTETGTRTRRERAAYVAKLKDELGMTFIQIGAQLHISSQRAQQLYTLNKYFQRSANSPFANLSTRARTFLNNVASHNHLGNDWEQDPAKIVAIVNALANMTKAEAFKFRQLGAHTFQEIADFMQQQGVKFPYEFDLGEAMDDDEFSGKELMPDSPCNGMPVIDDGQQIGRIFTGPAPQYQDHFKNSVWEVYFIREKDVLIQGMNMEAKSKFIGILVKQPDGWHYLDSTPDILSHPMPTAEDVVRYMLHYEHMTEALEDEGEVESKDLTRATTTEQSIELITQFLNEKGLRGEFKVWPPGTYKGQYAESAEFVITFSSFLADAFEENWSVVQEFDALVKSLGLHSEMATASVMTFYHDPYFDPDSIRIPQTPEQVQRPPPNLKDVSFD